MKKIVDKDRLARLDSTINQSALPQSQQQQQQLMQQQPQEQQQGLLGSIANSAPVNAALGAGDALRNMLSAGLLSNPTFTNFGYNKSPESSSGKSYEAGHIGGDIAGFIGGGEILDSLRGALAAKNIYGASKAASALGGEGISGIGRRLIGGSIAGGLENPDDRLGGAARGVGYSAVGETIPLIGKLGGKLAEHITPQKYTDKLVDEMKTVYNESKDKVKDLMEPITKKFGNYRVYITNKSKQFLNLPQDIVDKFPSALKKSYDDLLSNPNKFKFDDAHSLQKKFGEEMGEIMKTIPTEERRQTLSALREARESLKKDMINFIKPRNAQLANQWKRGSDTFRDEVVPFRSDAKLHKVLEGDKNSISPKDLQKSLFKLNDENKVPQGHYLSDALNDISAKLHRSELVKKGAALGLGTLGGGLSAGLPGAAGGAYLSKMITPGALDLASNPELLRMIKSGEPAYRNLVKGLIAPNLQRKK